ncbi:MAG: PolC-type DNA polymerase III [Oscillospiraceae bacterium]|nr:PolC-type DNA polymerase III [Oscillospiraceae bacterium]
MSASDNTLLYEVFPFCRGNDRLASDYSGARVISVTVDKARTTMKLTVSLSEPVPPMEITALEDIICSEYGLSNVSATAVYSRSASETWGHTGEPPVAKTGQNPTGTSPGVVIMGKRPGTSAKFTPIGDLSLDLGKANVKGEVCSVTTRYIEPSKAWLLRFDLTDYTGTIQVTKFMREENAASIAKKIKQGMWLTVAGTMSFSRYDADLVMEPRNIVSVSHEPRRDSAEEKRVELHLHTKMSALDAMTDTGDVIRRAIDWGHKAIAITDHGVVQSFPDAFYASGGIGGKIKVIYGIEGYFIADVGREEGEPPPLNKRGRSRIRHITLLAKNKTGLQNLYKLVTMSHLNDFSSRPIIKKSALDAHREGLIVGSACEAGEVFDAVSRKKDDEEIMLRAKYYDYLEIMPICNNAFMLTGDNAKASSEEDLRDFNRKVVEIGKALSIPVVATGDTHFLEPEHEIYRHILMASRGFDDADKDLPLYFKTTDEMLEEFSYLGEDTAYEVVVSNTNLIADMCENISPLPEKKLFTPAIERSAEDLKDLVYGKLCELYGKNPHELITKRLETELGDILDRGYDVIYMSAQKLVEASLKTGYLVGSRGSVGSSLVAFLAGITEVNSLPAHYRCPKCLHTDFSFSQEYGCGADMPDKPCPKCETIYVKDGFNIPFETFLGFDGDKVPDIDLNFSGEYQDQAHKHTIELFGEKNVYRAGTIGTIKEKTAYGYVKKYLDSKGKSVTKAEENRLSRGCVGVKRTTGQHPGGLIIIPQGMDITDFCPAQHPADDKDKGIITTHFDYHCMEDNLIKLDELGHDDPTMIKMLEDMTGVNATEIRLDDPDTLSIFTSPQKLGLPSDDEIVGTTGSIGIPEFGTSLTRQMLEDTKPKDFDTLVRLSGFSHGEGVWIGNSKELILSGKASVSETIGCRDDIMLFLISKGIKDRAAFKISESIRKGRGLPDGAEDEMKAKNVPSWYIESCKKIAYLFPKAHAVAYVMMAFRIAWFKVHRPLEFYSAYFYRRSQKDSFDAESMTKGIDIVKRKIKEIRNNPEAKSKEEDLLTTLEACYEFYMRGYSFAAIDLYDSDCVKFLIADEKTLRPPFVAISGLGSTAAKDLAESRTGREFISIDEISAICPKVQKSHLDQLKTLGALRNLPDSSQMSLF